SACAVGGRHGRRHRLLGSVIVVVVMAIIPVAVVVVAAVVTTAMVAAVVTVVIAILIAAVAIVPGLILRLRPLSDDQPDRAAGAQFGPRRRLGGDHGPFGNTVVIGSTALVGAEPGTGQLGGGITGRHAGHIRYGLLLAVDLTVTRILEPLDFHTVGDGTHVVLPDRRRDTTTEDVLVVLAVDRGTEHALGAFGVPHPHGGGQLWHVADEPGGRVHVRRTGLTGGGPLIEHRVLTGGPRRNHFLKRVVHRMRDLRFEYPVAVGIGNLQVLTRAGGHRFDGDRLAEGAAGGEGGERCSHRQWCDLVRAQ